MTDEEMEVCASYLKEISDDYEDLIENLFDEDFECFEQ